MQKTVQLEIKGMHCGGCVRRVTAALSSVPGLHVENVEVGAAKVRFEDGSISPDHIVTALDRIGFNASIHSEE